MKQIAKRYNSSKGLKETGLKMKLGLNSEIISYDKLSKSNLVIISRFNVEDFG